MQHVATVYLTIFVLFFRFAERSWSPEANAAKGAAGVTVVFSALVITAALWIGRLTGYGYLPGISKLGFVGIWFVIYLINYWLLVVKGYGMSFEREFRYFNKRRKMVLLTGGGTVIGCVIFLIVLAGLGRSL